MPRMLFCFAALGILALPCRAGEATKGSETVIRLSVAPAMPPTPALRYRLLPGLQEMNPGNPIQGYYKALMAHEAFFVDEEAAGRREALLAMPLEALRAAEVRDYGRHVLIQADRAARLDRPDWQILPGLRRDGFSLLLPDVQQLRSLANALKVRFRAELAAGQLDEAIRTAQTMFAMARHLGEHPTIIGNLVGVAIAFTAIDPLEEMLAQPGCPNLYWALTSLPRPFISMVTGMEGERVLILTELGALSDETPMNAEEIRQFAVHWDAISGSEKRVQSWIRKQTNDDEHVGAARRRLVESGLPEERLRQFSAVHVLLLDEKRECLARFDDAMKTMSLPSWQIDSLSARLSPKKAPALFADDLLSMQSRWRQAMGRLEQRIALLRHVEALRLYAAENHGTFPAKLSDVSVPLPDDLITGKPFHYEVRDNTAHLRGTPPPGTEETPGYRIHFEVTLRE